MYTHIHQVRVRYADTDQMGYVYYGCYANYYEEARSEAIRALGFPYKEMELNGLMLPVTRMSVKYIGPAFYDEVITIRTMIKEMPKRFVHFHYEIYSEHAKLINEGDTQLIFVDAHTRKMSHAPEELIEKLKGYFE
jgi:acyl-CoA thioester hydrolase